MGVEQRIKRIEAFLKKTKDSRCWDRGGIWKDLDPETVNFVKRAVEAFRERFSSRLPDLTNDGDEDVKAVFKNFSEIVKELILSMHRASIGSEADQRFIKIVSEEESLSIAHEYASEAFQKHEAKEGRV